MPVDTLSYPAAGQQTPPQRADQLAVRSYALTIDPQSEDGRSLVHGALELVAPGERAVPAAFVQLALRDASGQLIAGITHREQALAAGEERTCQVEQAVQLTAEVARVTLFTAIERHVPVPLPRGTASTRVLSARSSVSEPDPADGAQLVRAVVELQHTGVPSTLVITAELHLAGGSNHQLTLTPEPAELDRGHLVVTASEWFMPEDAAATAARPVLALRERIWTSGPTLDATGVITGPPQTLELPALTAAPAAEIPEGMTPWELLEAGHTDAAVTRLGPDDLDGPARERLRALLRSKDPLELAAGARVAAACQHRSAVSSLRRHLSHDSPLVRRAAVDALGVLAGPSLLVPVRALLKDPDPTVQQAAQDAILLLDR